MERRASPPIPERGSYPTCSPAGATRAFPGMKVYGFMPTINPATPRLAHNHDERARIDDLVPATRCLYDCIVRFRAR